MGKPTDDDIEYIQPWSGICLRSAGLSGLFFDKEIGRAMIGLLDVAKHTTRLRIDVYDLEGKLKVEPYIKNDISGIFNLSVDHSDSKQNITLNYDKTKETPTYKDRLLNFSYIPDLEKLYKKELPKDFSRLKARLYFHDGELCTYNLAPNKENNLIEVDFVTAEHEKFLEHFGNIADYCAVKIKLENEESAKLVFKQDDSEEESFHFESGNFYLLTLDNLCSETEKRPDEENDFELIYQSFVKLTKGDDKIVAKITNTSDRHGMLCGVIYFSQTRSF